VRALLDTHAFLWATTGDDRLSAAARALIEDGESELFLSAVTGYELLFKVAQGRLRLPADPITWLDSRMRSFDLRWLPVMGDHAVAAALLPRIHGDPWDRILVAQAQAASLPLVTVDRMIRRYDVETIW
jgi:PIN domain nuclease of toxin-antitoxin system